MRLGWHEYFIGIAKEVASRATCPRLSVGTVLVRKKNILSTGFNGSVGKSAHCIDVGCLMTDNHCARTVHSEVNAVALAAKHGVCIDKSIAYVTHTPCFNCAKILTNAGIRLIIFGEQYGSLESLSKVKELIKVYSIEEAKAKQLLLELDEE